MTSFLQGEIYVLWIEYQGQWKPIGCSTGDSMSESTDMIDTTTRDNPEGWQSSYPVKQNYSISFDGIVNPDKTGIYDYVDLLEISRGFTLVPWRLEDGSGGVYDQGEGYLSGMSQNAPTGDLMSYSGSINGAGKPGGAQSGVNTPTDINLVEL